MPYVNAFTSFLNFYIHIISIRRYGSIYTRFTILLSNVSHSDFILNLIIRNVLHRRIEMKLIVVSIAFY